MDHRAKLVAAALVGAVCGPAAALVSPSPPPGFGGTPGAWTFTPPSPTGQLDGIMRGPGPSIAGGGGRGAAYRLGGGAARALAGAAARGLIPGVGLALGIAWLASQCFEKQGGQWVRTCGGTPPPVSDGFEYNPKFTTGAPDVWHKSVTTACEAVRLWYIGVSVPANAQHISTTVTECTPAAYENGSGLVRLSMIYKIGSNPQETRTDFYGIASRGSAGCPVGWYVTPAGCVQTPPPQVVTPEEIEEEMAPKPLPPTLPNGVPYPLDPTLPSIWNPTETNPPQSQPLRVPQGNPIPIPNTDPQQYRQPVTRWTHSPTQAEPWRMDVQPEDVTSTSPTGMTSPENVTPESTQGTPKEEKNDLCALHPDIVACQKLGDLQATPLPNENKQLSINPDSGWGPSGGACPAPKTATVMGVHLELPFTMLCDFALGIKPLLLAFAWLTAAMTFMGLSRRD